MLRNRELSIKLKKPNGDETVDGEKTVVPFEDKVATALYVSKEITRQIAVGVAAYIVLDTWRQVKVAQATNHHRHD